MPLGKSYRQTYSRVCSPFGQVHLVCSEYECAILRDRKEDLKLSSFDFTVSKSFSAEVMMIVVLAICVHVWAAVHFCVWREGGVNIANSCHCLSVYVNRW